MNYKTGKVNFSSTGNYGSGPKNEDDVYTVEEFKEYCESGAFIDYDGYGYSVKDGYVMKDPNYDPDSDIFFDRYIVVRPSQIKHLPEDATHVIWFNN